MKCDSASLSIEHLSWAPAVASKWVSTLSHKCWALLSPALL